MMSSSTLGQVAEMRRKLHLFELISKTFEFERSTYLIHHLDCACKHVESHGTLWFNLLATDECHSRLSARADDTFQILCRLAVERQAEVMLHDMLIHVIKSLCTIIGLIGSLQALLPVLVPSMRNSNPKYPAHAIDTVG